MNKLASGTFETSIIKVAGIDVEVWRAGAGRPLVFLHPGDGLEPSSDILQRLSTRYDVIAASHPGFGATARPAGITTVDDLAYFYLDFFSELKLRDVIMVGVSFGAWIAAEIATKCTEVLSRLVLADALGVKFADRMTREIADLFSVPQYEQARLLYQDGQKQNFSDWPEEQLLRLARNHQSFALFAWSPTLHNPKLRQRLHRIDIPTLVLWGAEDKVVSTEYGQLFAAAIPGAEFEVLHGAGHYAHIEAADGFMAAINRFAEGNAEALN